MMTSFSPAKINLFLEVGPFDEKTGLHRLISLVDIINLQDTIEIEEAEKTEIKFISDWEIPDDNTVAKVLSIVKDTFHINRDVKVSIRKKIQPGSGLGGGSSNAFTVLRTLVDIWNLAITKQHLTDICLMVGSDVPLFIKGKRCIIEGFGDKVVSEKIPLVPLYYYLLIPPYGVSTAEIYRHLDMQESIRDLTSARDKIKILTECIRKKDIQGIEMTMFNRLEMVYLDLYKEGREVKKKVEKKTGKKFFVSGSGGTLFSLFSNRASAEEMAYFLDINGWKGYVVESIITS